MQDRVVWWVDPGQQLNTYTAACWLPTPTWDGRDNSKGKSKKTSRSRWRLFKSEGQRKTKEQVMQSQSLATSHEQTNAQPVSDQ